MGTETDDAWLQTPEIRETLARADEWMREHPPQETDIEALERQVLEKK